MSLRFSAHPVEYLDFEGMDVNGRLIVGSETGRIHISITITPSGRCHDQYYQPNSKGHQCEWTFYVESVGSFDGSYCGDAIAMVQHEVNWEAGQEVVIVTTAMRDSIDWHQNEVKDPFNILMMEAWERQYSWMHDVSPYCQSILPSRDWVAESYH